MAKTFRPWPFRWLFLAESKICYPTGVSGSNFRRYFTLKVALMQGWNICFYTPILHRAKSLRVARICYLRHLLRWSLITPLDLQLVSLKGRTFITAKTISKPSSLLLDLAHRKLPLSALQLNLAVEWTQWPCSIVHLPLVGSKNELSKNTNSPNIWAHLESRIELNKNWVQVYYR